MYVETDASCALGDHCASGKRLKDTLNGVVRHGEEKAARELGFGSGSVEQCWRSVSEKPLRQHVVRLDGRVDVFTMDTNGNAHQHLLRPLHRLAIDLQQVTALKSLEPEEKMPIT